MWIYNLENNKLMPPGVLIKPMGEKSKNKKSSFKYRRGDRISLKKYSTVQFLLLQISCKLKRHAMAPCSVA